MPACTSSGFRWSRRPHGTCGVIWIEPSKADLCCMPALKPGDALWLKQMEDNGLIDILPDGQRQLGKLAKFGRTPIELRREVPAPGENDPLLPSVEREANGAGRDDRAV